MAGEYKLITSDDTVSKTMNLEMKRGKGLCGEFYICDEAYDLLRDKLPAFIEQCIAEANDHLRDATKKGGGDHFADVSKKVNDGSE